MLKLNSNQKLKAQVILTLKIALMTTLMISLIATIPLSAQTKSDKKPKEQIKTEKTKNQEKSNQEKNTTKPTAREQEIEDSWLKELNNETKNQPNTNQDANSESIESNQSPTDVAPANTEIESTTPGSMFAEDTAPSFFGLLLRFLLVVGLLGGGLYLFVRFLKRKVGIMGPTEGGQLIQVIASVPIMPGKFIQIVELAGQMLVLGTSDSGVRLIYVVEDVTTAERIRLWHQSRPKAVATSLLDVIQKSIKKGEFKFWGDERVEDRPDFSELLNGQPSERSDQRLQDLLKSQKQKIQKLDQD